MSYTKKHSLETTAWNAPFGEFIESLTTPKPHKPMNEIIAKCSTINREYSYKGEDTKHYLEVSFNELHAMGIASKISDSSKIDYDKRLIYLDEDEDALDFMNAMKRNGIEMKYVVETRSEYDVIAKMASFDYGKFLKKL